MKRAQKKINRKNKILPILILLSIIFISSENINLKFQCISELGANDCSFEQGRAGVILCNLNEPALKIEAELWEKPVIFNKLDSEGKIWMAFIGVNLKQVPGDFLLRGNIHNPDGALKEFMHKIYVRSRKYPVERLTLPKEMVEFTPELLARVNRDNQTLISAMSDVNPECFWKDSFIQPVPGSVTGEFGASRIINNVPKNPHTGIDLQADPGQIVVAPNNGKVSLVYDGYLTGKSLIIDHGCGLYSIFYHLSEVLVNPGEMVKKNQMIAKTGATGRTSGPHLHFGIRILNNYVDPLSLIKISELAEETK